MLVEDFEPERLAFELTTGGQVHRPARPTSIDLEARYLYGAAAPNPFRRGDVDVKPSTTLAAYPGYEFGLTEESVEPTREPLEIDAATDEDGKATFDVTLPTLPSSTKPFDATLIIRVADTNGRAVERTLACRSRAPTAPLIGLKPLFDGDVRRRQPADSRRSWSAPDGSAPLKGRPRLEARAARNRLPVVQVGRQLELRARHHARARRQRHGRFTPPTAAPSSSPVN